MPMSTVQPYNPHYGTGGINFANNVSGGPYSFYQMPRSSYQDSFAFHNSLKAGDVAIPKESPRSPKEEAKEGEV